MPERVEGLRLAAVIRSYGTVGVPTDQLPYTPAFEELVGLVQELTGEEVEARECWRLLANARKRGLLPRLCR
jgi:hypothetical protein